MKFLSLNPEAFGMDFSDLRLRVAKLKKNGRFFDLASWGKIEINPGIIKQGEIKDEQALVDIIKLLLSKVKGERIKTKYVNACLPEKKAFLQVIQIPKMNLEELATAVPFEAENYIPLPIEETFLDFQIVPSISNHSDHLDVLIAGLPKKTVDPYVSVLKKADLIPKVLEVESQSIARAVVKNNVSPFPVLIIDFGRSATSFIIYSGYSIRFTSSIIVSSQELLVKQAKKCISYYHGHSNHQKINKILLCGRGSNLEGLPDFISSNLKIPSEIANPWVNILPESVKKIPNISFEESLGYTTALGLALRGIYD